jgi:hypothetical protein
VRLTIGFFPPNSRRDYLKEALFDEIVVQWTLGEYVAGGGE